MIDSAICKPFEIYCKVGHFGSKTALIAGSLPVAKSRVTSLVEKTTAIILSSYVQWCEVCTENNSTFTSYICAKKSSQGAAS